MVAPGESARVAAQLLGREVGGERAITVDQTNHSVVVGEEVVVKWLQPPVLSPHPGVQLLRHLASRGFDEMPAYIGAHEHDELVEATVTAFIPDARDGWDWFVDEVDGYLRGTEPMSRLLVLAERVGDLTGRLHTALADMQPTTVAARTYHAAAIERLDDALRVLPSEESSRLHALVPSIHAALAPLDSSTLLAAHRIHGDLHAGQFLRAGDRLYITDFDGNPMDSGETRRLPHSPLVDVASMLQSIDHVGRIVVKRRHPDRVGDVDHFISEAVASARESYRSVHTINDGVLGAMRVAQELHEYCYAARHLPRWLYVPDTALPALLQ